MDTAPRSTPRRTRRASAQRPAARHGHRLSSPALRNGHLLRAPPRPGRGGGFLRWKQGEQGQQGVVKRSTGMSVEVPGILDWYGGRRMRSTWARGAQRATGLLLCRRRHRTQLRPLVACLTASGGRAGQARSVSRMSRMALSVTKDAGSRACRSQDSPSRYARLGP